MLRTPQVLRDNGPRGTSQPAIEFWPTNHEANDAQPIIYADPISLLIREPPCSFTVATVKSGFVGTPAGSGEVVVAAGGAFG